MPPNRLAAEKNPYLLQHSLHPVEWYPWGEEAFEKARQENKPVFLSIGYSTCHWCHVMARESFADPGIAAQMNDVFVSIKVDREERPDIDNLYMAVCQMMTGSGGWPLTILMTPDRKPFFAATYLPRTSRHGHIGMAELIASVGDLWANRRHDLDRSAEEVIRRLKEVSTPVSGREPGVESLALAFRQLSSRFDEEHGGFGAAPKFPTAHVLTFLLRYGRRSGEGRALRMVQETLRAMRQGGIYDHVGFGFHRYATDERWFVPHFEKMLYDQALLAMAYLEGYLVSGDPLFRQTVEEVLTYVLRDLAAPQGGFYSAEDADSQGTEGAFYVWRDEDIRQILSPTDVDLVTLAFGLKPEGNFRDLASATRSGTNILHRDLSLGAVSAGTGQAEEHVRGRLETIREQLFLERQRRPRPHRDEKILMDWNGLMVAALARAGRTLDRCDFVEAAQKAASFVMRIMFCQQGGLSHRYADGDVAVPGFLDDYAFLAWGMLELYETTFQMMYLQTALQLTEKMLNDFWDEKDGGFFFTAADAERLHVRRKEIYDGAVPSGNSVAAMNLVRLGRMLGRPEYEQRAIDIGRTFSAEIGHSPSAYTQLLSTVEWMAGPSAEVVIVGDLASEQTRIMRRALSSRFCPHVVVLHRPPGPDAGEIGPLAEHVRSMAVIDGKTTTYVCRNWQCARPTTDVMEMLKLLE